MLIKQRDSMRRQLRGTEGLQVDSPCSELMNTVRERVKTEKSDHHLAKYNAEQTQKGAWKATRSILGQDYNFSPTQSRRHSCSLNITTTKSK